MKEKPIIFKEAMVKSILKGWKTQTRRAIKSSLVYSPCPYGRYCDVIWVKETYSVDRLGNYIYKADSTFKYKWKSATFMPRAACRIFLLITEVRIELLQDISERDINKEGFNSIDEFKIFWDSINLKSGYGWDTNPYVWVITFKKIN